MSLGRTHSSDIGSPGAQDDRGSARSARLPRGLLSARLPRGLLSARLPRAIASLALCAVAACANGIADESEYAGDGSLGGPGAPIDSDAAADAPDSEASEDGGLSGEGVRLRVFHGVLNLPNAYVCHDPDYVLDDPRTPEDEADPGPQPPVELRFNDAGSIAYGEATNYVLLPAMSAGAITVHRAPDPDAGVLGDAAAPLSPLDSALPPDAAGSDAGATPEEPRDAATSADAPATDAGPCDPATLESVLPLPATSAWFAPDLPSDAGLGLDLLGFVGSASNGDTLTLFGSGLALNPAELARRREAARNAHLAKDSTDTEGAEAAARGQVRSLESTYGARFLLARGAAPGPDRFGLSLAHLVPDVPSTSAYNQLDAGVGADAGSGALHLCVTVDQKESEVGDGGVARLEFRSVHVLGTQFDPSSSYRFRLFAEADYQQGAGSCVTTSLKPVARLDVDAGAFEGNRSYTLVASGAVAPANTCTTVNSTSLIRQTCARAVDALNAQIRIVPNDLPAAP